MQCWHLDRDVFKSALLSGPGPVSYNLIINSLPDKMVRTLLRLATRS
jgi:hypothetical protein